MKKEQSEIFRLLFVYITEKITYCIISSLKYLQVAMLTGNFPYNILILNNGFRINI